jgi:branched-chain amino acid transport system permease protein
LTLVGVLIAGVAVGAVYALIAIGYNITYLASGVINFAFANFVVLGGFLWLAARQDLQLSAVVAVVLVAIAVGVLGLVEERLAIRPLAGRSHAELITTVGTATVLTGLMLLVWGSEPLPVPALVPDTSLPVGGIDVALNDVVLIAVAAGAATTLHVVSRRTRIGLASLAQTEDREAATLRGVDVRRLSALAFGLAMLFAGLIGAIVATKTYASGTAALLLAIKGFVALTLGGLGNNLGALAGGVAVGIAEVAAARYIGDGYQDIVVFALFLVVVLLRPNGVFGTRVGRTV